MSSWRLSICSSLAECLAKTVGLPGSLKPVLVIITSSACVSAGLIGLDDSEFKGSLFAWSMEGSGISGGTSWIGSSACCTEGSYAGICYSVHGLWGLQPA